MKKGHSGKLHKNLTIRVTAIFTAVALLSVSVIPERFFEAFLPGMGAVFTVQAETLSENILLTLVKSNFSDAGRAHDITQEIVEDAVKSQRTSGMHWSEVPMQNVLHAVGDAIADRYPEPEEGQEPAEGTVFKNPWSEESENSPGSPYYPGTDYLGNDMLTSYTLGQLIIDYTRQARTGAAFLTDDDIVQIFDMLAGDSEDSEPFIDMDLFLGQVDAAITAASGFGSYEDQNVTNVLDRANSVTFGDYILTRSTPVPAGTLFIGTWLMDAQAVNSTFYRLAVYSMSSEDQQIMYYKSELAGNNWRNIYGASGLESILPIADNVQEASLLNYYVTVVVDENGIPRSPKTGEIVDIFRINDPYELEAIPELKSLKVQYDSGIVSSSDTGSKHYLYDRLTQFFKSDGKLERTDSMESDCRYVLDVANRTGIAFYAPDWRYTNWTTADIERYYCFIADRTSWLWRWIFRSTQSTARSGIGISFTAGAHKWRFEESGRGFLESLETLAEHGAKNDFRFEYEVGSSDYKGYWPYGGGEQDSKLIRGKPSWTNEKAWVNEVNGFGGIGELRRRLWSFQDVWSHFSSLQDETTEYYDERLAGMGDIYYAILHYDVNTGRMGASTDRAEDKELADQVLEICEMMDAGRRAQAYYNLVDNEKHNYIIGPVLNLLYEWVAYGESDVGRNYQLLEYTEEDYAQVSSITEAVENAIQACESSYIKYYNMVPQPGNTILSQAKYALINSVVDNAENGAPAVRSQLRELVDIGNIENNVIAHKSRELNTINALLDTADIKYQLYLHSASNDVYREAASDPNTTSSTLEEILQDQKADVNGVGAELQKLIKARAMRLDTVSAIDFIKERINWAEAQRTAITTDAFGTFANEALDEHLLWLRSLLNTVKEGGSITDETDDLRTKKAELELEYLSALDQNNLKSAADFAKKILEIQAQIDQADKRKRDAANAGDASPADKADEFNLESLQGVADKLADDALADIGNGNYDRLPDALDALGALGSPRLPEILKALEAHSAPVDLINDAKAAIAEADSSPYKDLFGDGDDGSGNGTGGTGDGAGGDGTGGNGSGTGGPGAVGTGGNTGDNSNGTGDTGDGNGSEGDGNGTGNGDNGDGTGKGENGEAFGGNLGLSKDDLGDAVRGALNGTPGSDLSDLDLAAAVAALEQFAVARDDAGAHDYAMDLLQQLLDSGSGFIYTQYLEDPSKEYVSLESVDKCRLYTRFRRAREKQDVTMVQIVQGTASYSFAVGSPAVTKNNNAVDTMDYPLVSQTDPVIRGDTITKYPYLTEEFCAKYMYCTCVYLKGTQLAVLVTPQMSSKIVALLDAFDALADGE